MLVPLIVHHWTMGMREDRAMAMAKDSGQDTLRVYQKREAHALFADSPEFEIVKEGETVPGVVECEQAQPPQEDIMLSSTPWLKCLHKVRA